MADVTAGETREKGLADVRAKIDEIDEAMHRLLIDRGTLIDELIALKRSSTTSAFRPDREAEMMRRLVARHEGALPITTVEHLWREIITTFTAIQAPFELVVAGKGRPGLRDLARFYFGFSVPISATETVAEALTRIGTGRDLALVPIERAPKEAWWRGLEGEGGPKILSRLPFVEMSRRPADTPAYVVGPPPERTSEADIAIVSIVVEDTMDNPVAALGGRVLARKGLATLVEVPADAEGEADGAVVGRIAAPISIRKGRA